MKKRFLTLFIMFSLAVHATILWFSLGRDEPVAPRESKVFKADLLAPADVEKPSFANQAQSPPGYGGRLAGADIMREASVGLENPGGIYQEYLLKIKRKIESRWSYPPQALAENREGRALIRFTIAADGRLTDSSVLSSSGSALLDEGALACIRAASPFDPLPVSFNISLLHVTATFSYIINI